MIRLANSNDKIPVLNFCQNTFSWGDYIEQVWDYWLSEGNLFLYEDQSVAGICHSLFFEDHIWVEGIRIDSSFRRQKIASSLVKHTESLGRNKNIATSYMLIDTTNIPSLSMAKSLDYHAYQSWNFYSLLPCRKNISTRVNYENTIPNDLILHYVDSWRWRSFDEETLQFLYKKNRIVSCQINEEKSFAIITDSKHFEKTMIVTLYVSSFDTVNEILTFLQNFANENNYQRIQILSKEDISVLDSLEFKISFNLMRKSLS